MPIGSIVIAESAANDFAVQTNTTLILIAPESFTFQFGVGPVSFTCYVSRAQLTGQFLNFATT